MPIVKIQDGQKPVGRATLPASKYDPTPQPPEDFQEPSTIEQVGLGQIVSNPAVSQIEKNFFDPSAQARNPYKEFDPEFKPSDHIRDDDDPDAIRGFATANSIEEMDLIRDRVALEKSREEILARSGFSGILASIAGSISDPVAWGMMAIPYIGTAAGIARMGRSATIATRAALGAAGGLAVTAEQEFLLRDAQVSRSEAESMNSLFWGTILGALVGGASGALTKNIVRKVETYADAASEATGRPNVKLDTSMGAAQVREQTFAEINAMESVQNMPKWIVDTGSLWIDGLQSVKQRVFFNEFATVKQTANRTFRNPYILGKTKQGQVQAETILEAEIDRAMLEIHNMNKVINANFLRLNGIEPGLGGDTKALIKGMQNKPGFVTMKEYNERVSEVLRTNIDSGIVEIDQSAKIIRSNISAKAKEMQALGIFDDLSEEQLSTYLTRRYNVPEILRDADNFKAKLNNHFRAKAAQAADRIKALAAKGGIDDVAKLQALVSRAMGNRSAVKDLIKEAELKIGLAPKELDELLSIMEKPSHMRVNTFNADEALDLAADVDKTFHNIIGLKEHSTEMERLLGTLVSGKSNITKSRALDIDDVDFAQYLLNDAGELGSHYIKQSSSMIAMKKLLNELGHDSIADIHNQLKREIIEKSRGLSPEAVEKLQKEGVKASKMIDDMFKVAMGVYKTKHGGDQAFRTLRAVQAAIYLGGMLISSLVDVINLAIPGKAKDGIRVSMQHLTNIRAVAKSKQQLEAIGVALDGEMDRTLKMLIDPEFNLYHQADTFDKILDINRQALSRATGMLYWNNSLKRVAGHTYQDMIIRQALNKDPRDLVEMARLGLNADDLDQIAAAFKKYGQIENGVHIPDLDFWASSSEFREITKKYGDVLRSAVDSIVVTPGRGDLPFAAQMSEFHSLIFQFKSFMFASAGKIFLPLLQRDKTKFLALYMASIMTGGASFMIKEALAGRDPSDVTIDQFIAEGVFRSGITLPLFTIADAFYSFGNDNPMWAGNRGQGVLLGPLPNTIASASGFLSTSMQKGLGEGWDRYGQYITPYGNLWWMKLLNDEAFGSDD